jgi:hypothetical protein
MAIMESNFFLENRMLYRLAVIILQSPHFVCIFLLLYFYQQKSPQKCFQLGTLTLFR